jgi:hypothetical protein
MAGHGQSERNLDPGSRLILAELRDLRLEMRADRRQANEDRREANEERRQANEERRQANEERRQANEERRRADLEWREERREADARFERMMRDFQHDAGRREVETQKVLKDIRTVGLSIVKTLNHHTCILERIERKLTGRGNGRPGPEDGGSSPRK